MSGIQSIAKLGLFSIIDWMVRIVVLTAAEKVLVI